MLVQRALIFGNPVTEVLLLPHSALTQYVSVLLNRIALGSGVKAGQTGGTCTHGHIASVHSGNLREKTIRNVLHGNLSVLG
tara:strand:+ start:282 stop:524 length:243 start_codon:yes stop_codon:yes gene_type:complete